MTARNSRSRQETRGLLVWIITLPVRIFKWIFRIGVVGRRETSHKKMFWKCNYCGATFADKTTGPKDEKASKETTKRLKDAGVID